VESSSVRLRFGGGAHGPAALMPDALVAYGTGSNVSDLPLTHAAVSDYTRGR
jgi:hypothetical protein